MRDMFTSSLFSSPSSTSSPPPSLLRPSSTSSAHPSPSSDLLALCRRVVSAQRLGSTGLSGASAALLAQFRRLYTGQKEYSDDCVIDIMRAMAAHEHNRVVRSTASADSAPIDLTAEQDGDDVANSHHDGRQREEKHGSVDDDETEDEDEQKAGLPSTSSSAARQPCTNICSSGLSSRRRMSSLTVGWEEEVADRAASLVLLKQEEAVRQEKAASVRLWRERGRSCRSFGRRVAVLLCWSLAALLLLAVLAVVGCWVAPWMMELREQLVDHSGEGGLWGWMTGAEVASPQSEGTGMLEQVWVALSAAVESAASTHTQ